MTTLLCFVSGLLASLSIPTTISSRWGFVVLPDLGFLAWFAFVPFYLCLKTSSFKQGLRRGFAFGFGYFGVCLYWFFIALYYYGDISLWASLLGAGCVWIFGGLFTASSSGVFIFLKQRQSRFTPFFWPIAFIAQEFLRNEIPFGGFPWANPAYSQRSFLTFLQLLDITGVYGLLFLILLSNVLLGEIYLWLRKRREVPLILAGSFLILFVSTLIYGKFRLAEIRKEGSSRKTLRVALVQGNIDQKQKWREDLVETILDQHFALNRSVENFNPDLIVWPEAAYPVVVPPHVKGLKRFQSTEKPLLLGVVRYEDKISNQDRSPLYNSVVLLQPGGEIQDFYDKRHLVPLGEYVPLGEFFPSVQKIVPAISDFTPGKRENLFYLEDKNQDQDVPFGVTICYEDLFPEISRGFAKIGAEVLFNLTNDAWYERSSAVFQHRDFSLFRAIENRRTMVRSTNTGITAVFSPSGEIIAQAPPFEEAVLTAEVIVGGPLTFYTQYGDVFAWICVALLSLLFLWRLYERTARTT